MSDSKNNDSKENKEYQSSGEDWGEASDNTRKPRVITLPVTKENRLIILLVL